MLEHFAKAMSADDDLRDEVEEMFRGEARKAKHEAVPKWTMPPGYYDEKLDRGGVEDGYTEFMRELFEVKRLKHPNRRKKK